MRSLLSSLVLIAACTEEDAPMVHIAGSPDATRTVAFDADGGLVAIGGPSAFGLAHLQRLDGEQWVQAEGVAGFGARVQLIGGGDLPLYAVGETTLYRLDDVAAFRWSAFPIPLGVTDGTVFGVDAMGAVYGIDLSEGEGFVVTWMPGDQRWLELAGSRPLVATAHGYVVEPAGRVTWIDPETGVVRLDGGAQTTLVEPGPFASLTYDARGNLTFLACPAEQPPRMAKRLRAGATVAQDAMIPTSDTACHGLTTAPDGTSLLATLDGSGAGGTLSVWRPGEDGWSRVAPATSALRYTIRDGTSAFGYADALELRGIYRIDF
ncbi:MAG: hypothetical protein SFX73_32615 [Kofleriaceae bacterium]|nr:hypothetical protein [Kofleriaceae bacterium]